MSETANISSSVTDSKSTKSPWLHAWYDPLANLKTSSACVRFADINGDGDSKLCICDFEKKIKVYKGTSLVVEYALLDQPVAMCVTYSENSMPRLPSLAVAAGSHIFIYRQLRPYRKWSCPLVEIPPSELEVWNDLKSDAITPIAAFKALSEQRDSGVNLSSRSMELLGLETDTLRTTFIENMKEASYIQNTLITCMETLAKDSDESDALSMLVVGTEAKQLYILPLNPSGSTFLCKLTLPAVPAHICVQGCFDVEFRIFVACRDGKIYGVKNGDVRGTAVFSGSVIDIGAQAVALAKQDKMLWVAATDRTVTCYSNRGKKSKTLLFNEDIHEISVLSMRRAKLNHLLQVALTSGEVRMYRDGSLVHSFQLERSISAMRFGPYGREDSTLVLVHGKGALTIKIWRRLADIESMMPSTGPPPEQDVPLPVPKKTKLYVEQTQRERDSAPHMHRLFQRDLCKLRLETARAYVKTITDGYMGASPLGSQEIRVQAQVLGLGPSFVLKVTLQNAGTQPIFQARMFFSFDPSLYSMISPTLLVPALLPGVRHIVEAQVQSLDPLGRAGQVMLLLKHPLNPSPTPLLSASIRMPPAELAV